MTLTPTRAALTFVSVTTAVHRRYQANTSWIWSRGMFVGSYDCSCWKRAGRTGKHQPARGFFWSFMWIKAYVTFVRQPCGEGGVDVARDREGAINDGWWDDGEGSCRQGGKYQEFIIFHFRLRVADKADQRRISSARSALRARPPNASSTNPFVWFVVTSRLGQFRDSFTLNSNSAAALMAARQRTRRPGRAPPFVHLSPW